MKIFKTNFIVTSFIIIILIFIFQFFYISKSYKIDTNSYVTLVKGNWILTSDEEKKVLKIDQKETLKVWDVVSTIWADSLAVIEWWDKSITRLSWNSKILIKENLISDDLWKINISFELLKWKTWSNVITIIWENSYFKQDVKWVTASVRWTIYETSYENDYLYVQDHQVNVTNLEWDVKLIQAWEWFLFSSFSIDKLLEIRDKAWEKINSDLDTEYYNNLREQFLNSFSESWLSNLYSWLLTWNEKIVSLAMNWDYEELNNYISSLPEEDKTQAITFLNTLMQLSNFENGTNENMYNLKLNLKDILISNSSDQDYKETLLKYTMYDLSSMFDSEWINSEVFKNTLSLLEENKSLIDLWADKFNLTWENYYMIKSFLTWWDPEPLINKVKWKLNDLDEKWKEAMSNWLNNIFNVEKK